MKREIQIETEVWSDFEARRFNRIHRITFRLSHLGGVYNRSKRYYIML